MRRDRSLPLAHSLQRELAAAIRTSRPLIVMVSLHGCAYCKIVRDQYLIPMMSEDGQPIVQVDMQSSAELQDFRGERRTHDELVRSWGIPLAPTLLFFGPSGRELVPRLAGVPTLDFYGAFLSERVQRARDQVAIAHR